jgi:hypothetical protein
MLEELMGKPVPYAAARDDIAPGDLLFLHHAFVANWYGAQIEAVQRFTGPFAHVASFDRIVLGGEDRVVVLESVVPKQRCVLVSATAEAGFFWVAMKRPMSKAERESWWRELGADPFVYDKLGAIEAGADLLPPDEDANPRRWCAKSVAIRRRESDVDLAPRRHARDPGRYVPTDMYFEAVNRFNGAAHFVSM